MDLFIMHGDTIYSFQQSSSFLYISFVKKKISM